MLLNKKTCLVSVACVATSMFTMNSITANPTNITNSQYDRVLEIIDEDLENEINFISIHQEARIPNGVVHTEQVDTHKKTYTTIKVVATYYTSLEEENGKGLAGKNAVGGYLSNTSIAIPRPNKNSIVKYGTKIEFDNLGEQYMKDYKGKYLTRIADDCGNPKNIRIREDGVYRMDIYCPRLAGESTNAYKKRVMSYGKFETTAKVYLDNK